MSRCGLVGLVLRNDGGAAVIHWSRDVILKSRGVNLECKMGSVKY